MGAFFAGVPQDIGGAGRGLERRGVVLVRQRMVLGAPFGLQMNTACAIRLPTAGKWDRYTPV